MAHTWLVVHAVGVQVGVPRILVALFVSRGAPISEQCIVQGNGQCRAALGAVRGAERQGLCFLVGAVIVYRCVKGDEGLFWDAKRTL